MRGTLPTLLVLLATLLAAPVARADDIEVRESRLEQTEDGVTLSADFSFDFNARLENLVTNGVPLYFVVEFELSRPRWYWFDEKTASRKLQTRLSYHALSRHYRLSTGLLQQNYASLSEALSVLRRVRHWQVLDRDIALSDGIYQAAVRMRLDLALLPKPFQVSALTSREWHLESDWRRFSWRQGKESALQSPSPPAAPVPDSPPGSAAVRDEAPTK